MKKLLALLLSLVFVFALVSCDDDLPEIPDDIYTDDQGTHLPPIDYIPPEQ